MSAQSPAFGSLFPSRLTEVLADMSCVVFRREMSPDGEIAYPWFSDNLTDILGYRPADMTVSSKGALNAIHWADRDAHVAAIRHSATAMSRCVEAFRAVTADGETRWFRGSASPAFTENGVLVWEGAWIDISPWMRAEHQFQTVMDHAEDCILTLDARNGIDWANAATERLFGWMLADMRGRCLSNLLEQRCGQYTPGSECCAGELVQCFPRGTQEVMARHRDGTIFPFEMTVSEVRSDGRLSLIVIGRDITRRRTTEMMLTDEIEERKKAEKAIRESEERFRLAFAAASLGIVMLSMDGTIQQCNPAFLSMCGRGEGELDGTSIHAFIDIHHLPNVESLALQGEPFCLHCNPYLPDGAERHWRVTGTHFSATPNAASPSLLLLVEDVTDMVRAADELRQMEFALQEGHKLEALGRLAGGVAHELNNMLGPILMAAEMVERSAPLDERNRQRTRRIIDAAKHGRDIVRNVLSYCRNEEKASLGAVDIVPVFSEFADLAASILPPSVRVETYIDADSAMITGDVGQITQVLLNLANNARDAMDGDGTLTLALAVVAPRDLVPPGQTRDRRRPDGIQPNPFAKLDPSLPYVELSICDTGCGMRPETAAKIFDPFFTTKPVGQGTGLGLSVVQGIVKAMGGIVAVDSRLGEGTTFRIVLPTIPGELAD